MFLPDTIRNCMIETDVSSYLQTTSTGQVENFVCLRKSKKNTSLINPIKIPINHLVMLILTFLFFLKIQKLNYGVANLKHQQYSSTHHVRRAPFYL
jgi:hypothetical protein